MRTVSVLTTVRPAMGPRLICATPGCDRCAQFRGRCIQCFETLETWDESVQLDEAARIRRRAWMYRQLGALRQAWPWIVAAIAVEYLLLWEFREWFIEIGMWFSGGAN